MINKWAIGLLLIISLPTFLQTLPASALDGENYDTPVNSFYNEDSQHWLELDNEFTPATAPWDWEVTEADYQLRVKEDFTAGQILEFEIDGSTINLQPMALEWSNDLSQIQQVSMPQDVAPFITNPEVDSYGLVKHQGTITWNDAYGPNIDFQWKSTPAILEKTLTVSSLNDLPIPEQYIMDGGNPFLRLNLIFGPSSDLDIYVGGELWDKKTKIQTFDNIEFRKDGEILWSFKPLMYWDNEGNEGQSVATLEKAGNDLYISIRVPYSWLQAAVYPIYIDADIAIDANVASTFAVRAFRSGVFWTSPTVGYVIYLDANNDLVYRKTADGGATWDAHVDIVAPGSGDILLYDSWADWQTVDDSGTKIHIAYMSLDTNEVRYVYLDTSDDSVGGDDLIETCQGTGTFFGELNLTWNMISITKTRGGNLAVALKYVDDGFSVFTAFYTSPDATTWTSKTTPYEANGDFCIIFPGNEADNQDVWATYWDVSTNEISLKTFDDSGNSWSEQLISANMIENAGFIQMDGAIRFSDGHLIFAAWNIYDNADADLMVWDINGAGSITAKTNVITDTAEYVTVSVFINQVNDDIYIAYLGGTVWTNLVVALYQKSSNGGANWDGQTAMQANAEDDERWISAGAMKAAWGGKFQPVWFNDDLNDLFTNTDNGISIAADVIVPPTVVTGNATLIEKTTATVSGNITATGGENADRRGIVWDLATQGSPGDVAPGASGYANDVFSSGNFTVGVFSENLTSLPPDDTIYARAYGHNSGGYAYGDEINFLTKSIPPIAAPPAAITIPPVSPTGKNILVGLIPLALLTTLAFWKPNVALFMLVGTIAIFVGLQWYDVYVNSNGLAMGMSLLVYGIISYGFAFKCIFIREREGE